MDYYQGYDDAMRQTRVHRTAGLTGFILRLILSVLYGAFIYIPLLLVGYWMANKMNSLYSDDQIIKIVLTLACAYVVFSFIYFLKGLLIGMRTRGQSLWIIVWITCVIVTSGIQMFISQNLLESFFSSRSVVNHEVWSWLGAVAVGVLIYSHYRFLTNVAPRSVFWSYNFGFLATRQTGSQDETTPKKSVTYFDNAPMKVSFKK